MNDYIDKIVSALNTLYGLPAVALVFGSCIALGYVLRFVRRFPNDGIPVAVILWGGIAMSVIADSRASSMPLRVWIVRNLLVGMIIGLGAWLVHKIALSRLEDWVAKRFSALTDTAFFKKEDKTDATPKDP